MHDHTLARLAVCLMLTGSLAISCSEPDPGTASGTGGATPSSSGGSAPGSTGGATPSSSGGSSTGGAAPSSSGGSPATGGRVGSGGATVSTGGADAGGTGGRGSGGAAGGNGSAGRAATGGSSSGGAGGSGTGGAGPGTGGTTGGSGTPGNYPLGNAPVKSAGCGNTMGVATITSGGTAVASGLATSKRVKFMSGGSNREYIIDIPADYDPNKVYKLYLTFHWIGSSDTAVATGSVSTGGAANWGFYGLHRMAMGANAPGIFIAPQALPGPNGTWDTGKPVDHAFVDDILMKATAALCIDESRVFATGFSFGGMMTYSLSTNHQKVIRAATGIAPANYNIYVPNPLPHDPIAWMSTTGMNDGTCPWGAGSARGAEAIAKMRGMDNGCMVPASVPTWTSASPARHICYDFTGCKANYPVKACTFNGNHQAAPYDAGAGDNGLTSWIPTETWKFFSQF